jgi:predicted DNA-binding transcriptional regulator YafY
VSVSLEKQTFSPKQAIGDDVFANSLGVNTGPTAKVEIAFEPAVAPYVRARVWHSSQETRDVDGGGLVLTMNVCHDRALRNWILGWGSAAKVISPAGLARDVRRDLEAAARVYAGGS